MLEEFSAIVRDLSQKGLAVIDHPDGRVFFVRGLWPGDSALFQVAPGAPRYSEAKVINIHSFSPDRLPVICPHRGPDPGQCGGCPWMMASYSAQLEFKVKRLIHALNKRKINFTPSLRTIIPSTTIYGYRNRAQFKTDGVSIGYVSEGTSVLAPIEDCVILNDKLRQLLRAMRAQLPRADYRPTGQHQWNYLDIDDEVELNEVKLNQRRPFKQGNTSQNETMKDWVRRKFSILSSHFPIIDLFCGSGNFTEVLSNLGFNNILAVEVQGVALDTLKSKSLPGVRILELDMNSKGAWQTVAKYQPHAKAILIDPPREGLTKRRGFFKYLDNIENIFYISCELDTFARDAQDIISQGWILEELTPLDLFPHTPHVEILAKFTKENLSKK
jgi:23S rRNA (uracil1939-C5)-methyltransferase